MKADAGWENFWDPANDKQRARLRQYKRYLEAHWAPALPVRLHFRQSRDNVAYVWPSDDGKRLNLYLDPRLPFQWALECLIHEWAHAVVHFTDPEHHRAAFRGVLLELTDAYEEGDMEEDSKAW